MDFKTAVPIETEILQASQWTSPWTYALTASIVANCPVGSTKEVYEKVFKKITIDHYKTVIPQMIRIKEILAERCVKGQDLNLAEGIKGLSSLAKLVQRQVKQARDGTQRRTRRGNRSKKDLSSDTSRLESDEAG